VTQPDIRVINVLLVEDDPGDVLMTREAFDDYLHNRLDVVTDGAAALAYLRKEPPYEDTPRRFSLRSQEGAFDDSYVHVAAISGLRSS
jgi:CheY-like chemotaxis protein